jgi:hypothetical protein
VDVEGGAAPIGRFAHDVAEEVQCLGEGPGKGVFQRAWGGLAFACFREIGGEKTIGDDGEKVAVIRGRQTVTAFDFGQETLGHEQALLFQVGRKHHILPLLVVPACLAPGRRERWGGAPDAQRTPKFSNTLPMR